MHSNKANKRPTALDKILSGEQESFALIYRQGHFDVPLVEIMCGTEHSLSHIHELEPSILQKCAALNKNALVVAPYHQISERGYVAVNDGAPLIAMMMDMSETSSIQEVLARLPETELCLQDPHFDITDDEYKSIVTRVVEDEIGTGQGANFVIRRTFVAHFTDYSDKVAMTIFKNLLRQEVGSYWTFLIRTRDMAFIGASPERHITLRDKSVSMTPVSGTYRFPPTGPTCDGLVEFLSDEKEKNELYMVLDEELKMMTKICEAEVKAYGPYLTTMSKLAHTGYRLEGVSDLPISKILELSMFAPTVTGSPLENAARVIARYEPEGRSYYSGFAALIEYEDNNATLDSTILIRTAEIAPSGRMRAGVGATIVRDSEPASEAAETAAKAAALQYAMGFNSLSSLLSDISVNTALEKRNDRISRFWLSEKSDIVSQVGIIDGNMKAMIVDNEDTFTSMMEYQLRTMELAVRVEHYTSKIIPDYNELLVIGPGPGEPRDSADPRVLTSRRLMLDAMKSGRPFIAICFGHQVLCTTLGLSVETMNRPNQGLQREISFFGSQETVGFYNTFTACARENTIQTPSGVVHISRDITTGYVFGLRGPNFSSMQFHPESVLTIDGPRILKEAIMSAVASCSSNLFGKHNARRQASFLNT